MLSNPANNHPVFRIGACTKCEGAQQLCEDNAGKYLRCMNCGKTVDLESPWKEEGRKRPGGKYGPR